MTPDTSKIYDVAVIGGGSAGTMAYLRSVLNFDDTVWFLGDADTKRRARATWVFDVDNIPGLHGIKKPIDAPAKSTQKWVESQETLKEKSTVIKKRVGALAQEDGIFTLIIEGKNGEGKNGESSYRARYVVLATGVMDRQPLINGSIEPIFPYANRGDFIYCLRCDGHRTLGKSLGVIGPQKMASQIATLMQERYGHPTVQVIVPDSKPGEETLPLGEGQTLHRSSIVDILGDPKAGLEGLVLENGTKVPFEKAIVAMGSIVYNELARSLGTELAEDGRITVGDANESSVAGLFVVGDLVAGKKMQIYTGWDEAVDAADRINARLRRRRREQSKKVA